MKKVLVYLLSLILVISFVSANMAVELNVETDGGDADVWVNPNTGDGETNYYLDGKNFDDTIVELNNNIGMASESGISISSVFSKLVKTFAKYDSRSKKYYINDPDKFQYEMQGVFRDIMYYVFVPRSELNNILNSQNLKIDQLKLEVEVLQNMFTKQEICKSRMAIGYKYEIDKITCGNETYHRSLTTKEYFKFN